MGPQRNSVASLITFWLECLRSPGSIGSIIPSSGTLSRSIAKEVFSCPPGQIIELGAGTGAITETLIDLSECVNKIVIIEKSIRLAEILRSKFFGIKIECCSAAEIGKLDIDDALPVTIISSIPFRSLKRQEKNEIVSAISNIHQKAKMFRLIQYSYLFSPPFSPPHGLRWRKGGVVFSNIPPARIWILVP